MLARLGVAADLFRIAVVVGALGGCRDEPGAEALDLFTGLGPDVVCVDDGTKSAGCRDRLKTGNPDPQDEHLGGRDGAGRGHHHGESARRGGGTL